MIYLVGGAPRTGKSLLAQQLAATRSAGWISTDVLLDLLRLHKPEGVKAEWNPAPEAIAANANWFFPFLERLVRGLSALADNYVIEGVDFLPAQVVQLSAQYPLRAIFLGRSQMTADELDRFPGRSPGYSRLPSALRRQIARISRAGVNSFGKSASALTHSLWI